MELQEYLTLVKALHPHEINEEALTEILLHLKLRVLFELYNGDRNAFIKMEYYSPFIDMYWKYLVAMIELLEGDMERYRASYALFREAWEDYREYLLQHGVVDMEAFMNENET